MWACVLLFLFLYPLSSIIYNHWLLLMHILTSQTVGFQFRGVSLHTEIFEGHLKVAIQTSIQVGMRGGTWRLVGLTTPPYPDILCICLCVDGCEELQKIHSRPWQEHMFISPASCRVCGTEKVLNKYSGIIGCYVNGRKFISLTNNESIVWGRKEESSCEGKRPYQIWFRYFPFAF